MVFSPLQAFSSSPLPVWLRLSALLCPLFFAGAAAGFSETAFVLTALCAFTLFGVSFVFCGFCAVSAFAGCETFFSSAAVSQRSFCRRFLSGGLFFPPLFFCQRTPSPLLRAWQALSKKQQTSGAHRRKCFAQNRAWAFYGFGWPKSRCPCRRSAGYQSLKSRDKFPLSAHRFYNPDGAQVRNCNADDLSAFLSLRRNAMTLCVCHPAQSTGILPRSRPLPKEQGFCGTAHSVRALLLHLNVFIVIQKQPVELFCLIHSMNWANS